MDSIDRLTRAIIEAEEILERNRQDLRNELKREKDFQIVIEVQGNTYNSCSEGSLPAPWLDQYNC